MTELYLAHWGIKGQRWGFRRFQNEDGSLTPAGKNRYRGENSSPRHKASEARKRAKAEEDARQFEENRQKALRTGNATEVLKYKNYSSQKEMDDALRRINTERLLADISAKETAKGKSVVDKVVDTADKWRERAEKGIKVWNLAAKVHNSFVDEDDAWQQIGEKSVKEAKIERAKERLEKMNKKEREKLLAEYAQKYGDYNEVKNNINSMTIKEAKAALKRFEPEKTDPKTESQRQKLIKQYVVSFGSNKKVESYLDSLSTDDLKALLKRKSKEKGKEDDD